MGGLFRERRSRHSLTGCAFFLKYQDRILMGKDTFGDEDEYAVYFRIFETNDECFPWYWRRHAFWGMYGLGLPGEVLRKVCYRNALRMVKGIDATGFPPQKLQD
jgi:hypothetical protein